MTVQERCWSKVPKLLLKPEDIGATLKEEEVKKLTISFVTLVNYVAVEHARCGKPAPDGE